MPRLRLGGSRLAAAAPSRPAPPLFPAASTSTTAASHRTPIAPLTTALAFETPVARQETARPVYQHRAMSSSSSPRVRRTAVFGQIPSPSASSSSLRSPTASRLKAPVFVTPTIHGEEGQRPRAILTPAATSRVMLDVSNTPAPHSAMAGEIVRSAEQIEADKRAFALMDAMNAILEEMRNEVIEFPGVVEAPRKKVKSSLLSKENIAPKDREANMAKRVPAYYGTRVARTRGARKGVGAGVSLAKDFRL
ncbi:hypothetical protein BOTBODRAFT_37282 [Botryobasidium botryosum FD-172 SS1]|uniref:Uncharacterized protein n=1 Tax=Botryobasidium botryosum (strain FD-172 SS1) TaxID=930990 RepID=A0A067M0V6_BOTB1|nr:hypothetical protein BOTBODRAFT_37282 [Botryobasidium botryosum FD-172 SS1]